MDGTRLLLLLLLFLKVHQGVRLSFLDFVAVVSFFSQSIFVFAFYFLLMFLEFLFPLSLAL